MVKSQDQSNVISYIKQYDISQYIYIHEGIGPQDKNYVSDQGCID